MLSQPPQWQQDANRHSVLVDPVVTIQELSRFKPLRATRIDHALVFTTAQGALDTYLPPRRPSRTELATRRWTSVYEVDMGLHECATVLALASQNDAFLFEVSLSCTWQVLDPAAVVASGERNVPAMVQRLVEQAVRPVLRGYAMQDSAAAELHARKAVEATGPLGTHAGLEVRCGLQIRRDEAALEQERRLREIEFARQKLEPQHTLLMREDELAAERALAQGEQQHRVELQQQTLDHQRRMARGHQELELQEIEAKKIDYYTYYLERGGPAAMAFQLARHPEDARLIMENLRQDQLLTMKNQLTVALQALGGGPGGLEEHQMDEPRRLAANVIREVLSAKLSQGAAPQLAAADVLPAPDTGEGRAPGTGAASPTAEGGGAPPQASPPGESPEDTPPPPLPENGPVFGYPAPPQPPR
ncbi:PE-PGRS family protein [Streptomyces sp. BR123]|uniref:PE-PGRS family protein n=1 Tax=Streptomyces sp. BR123 TaxID=2749828 RepID=UPI0015C4DD91|nr:PE-PGRS family protein [Streptomyces sp. BR123]NXY96928.1 PE-PGRS family protein [Streptomyces sp. BR123]